MIVATAKRVCSARRPRTSIRQMRVRRPTHPDKTWYIGKGPVRRPFGVDAPVIASRDERPPTDHGDADARKLSAGRADPRASDRAGHRLTDRPLPR
jgi:hypothetical protein